MNRAARSAPLLLVLSTVFLSAQQPSIAPPTSRPQAGARNAGVWAGRLARIDAVLQHYGASGMNSVGGFGWGGAYGSWYRVDSDEKLVIVLMIQLIPNETDIREKFPTLVYQALDGAPRTGSN